MISSSDRVSPSFLLLELPSFPARRIRAIMGPRGPLAAIKPSRLETKMRSRQRIKNVVSKDCGCALPPFSSQRQCPFSPSGPSGDNVITLTRMQAAQRPCIWVCNLGRYLTPTSLDWLFICVCVRVCLSLDGRRGWRLFTFDERGPATLVRGAQVDDPESRVIGSLSLSL